MAPQYRVLLTFAPPQSVISFQEAMYALNTQGVSIQTFRINHRWRKHWRDIIRHDILFLYSCLFRKYDLVLFNSGLLFFHRPILFRLAISICRFRSIRYGFVWHNAPILVDELKKKIGHSAFERRRVSFRTTPIHLSVSEYVSDNVERLIGCLRPKVLFNARAISMTSEMCSSDPRNPLVINVGNTRHHKGPDLFVEIAAKALRRRPDIKFRWIGGSPSHDLLKRIDELNLGESIEFMPFVDDPFPLMAPASVLMFTSRDEGFGLVVAEALALGITPIVFDGHGATEVAGDAGIIIGDFDTNAAADSIIELLNVRTDQFRLQSRSRYLEKFSPSAFAQRFRGILDDILVIERPTERHDA